MRRKVIAGNWKMNMLPNEAINFIEELTPLVSDTKNEVILCVPYTDLFYSLLNVQGTNIKIGAQNMHWEEKGAYTGEVSAQMLKSIGVEYVIIGHSERRQYFAETDETVNKKVKSALAVGLKPIICVGETLEQRESGQTETIVTSQIEKALEGVAKEDANATIMQIRKKIAEIYGQNNADGVIIQYGGSVKSSNAKELFEMSDIDGGLVGGASLKAEEFSKIVKFDE